RTVVRRIDLEILLGRPGRPFGQAIDELAQGAPPARVASHLRPRRVAAARAEYLEREARRARLDDLGGSHSDSQPPASVGVADDVAAGRERGRGRVCRPRARTAAARAPGVPDFKAEHPVTRRNLARTPGQAPGSDRAAIAKIPGDLEAAGR